VTRKKLLFLYLIVISVLLAALFQIKYTVLDLESEHSKLRRVIKGKQEQLQVFKAEWACLNDPERLFTLSKKYLQLRPIRGEQIVAYKDLQNSGMGEYDRERLRAILEGKGAASRIRKQPGDEPKTASKETLRSSSVKGKPR
jgi:cell division protein FtsL